LWFVEGNHRYRGVHANELLSGSGVAVAWKSVGGPVLFVFGPTPVGFRHNSPVDRKPLSGRLAGACDELGLELRGVLSGQVFKQNIVPNTVLRTNLERA
jgi:hypothetical protein